VMQMEWTAALRDASRQRQIITAEFLQPYRSTGGQMCSSYTTCLACMTDTACGWCVNNNKNNNNNEQWCVDRRELQVSTGCEANSASFIVNAQYCPVCADHVTCSSCLQVCIVMTTTTVTTTSAYCYYWFCYRCWYIEDKTCL